jgi:hypothetical protein
MALDKASLKTALESLFTSPPATAADCADAWAAAYRAYAAGAKSCGAPGAPAGASLDAAKAVLTAALLAAFSGSDPASTAAAFATALTAFWLTPPVAFAGATPGAVIAVAGSAALPSALTAMWASNVASAASAADAAQAHADLFDAFTKTVTVAHAPPSACAAPVT